MNNNLIDPADVDIRDAVFERCHRENVSAVIACLAEHEEFDVVEYDFPLCIDGRDMLADRVCHIDGESFRIDFSESNFSREKYEKMDAEERIAFRIDRLVGHTHSVVVRVGEWRTVPEVAIKDIVRLRFLVEFLTRVGDSEFDDRAFEEEIETKTAEEMTKVILCLKRK